MTAIRLEPGFWMDPRLIEAGNSATGAYVRMLAYAGRHETDGVIPETVASLILSGEDMDVLGDVGLVTRGDAGTIRVDPPRRMGGAERYELRPRRLRRAAGYATPAQVAARVEFYGGLCWICRTAPYEAIDHVKPIARGGSKWPANLRPACQPCNSRKGARWPLGARA